MLAFTVACATLTGLLFGIAPAVVAGEPARRRSCGSAPDRARAEPVSYNGRSSRRNSRFPWSCSWRPRCSGRSLLALSTVDPGFRADGLMALNVALPSGYPDRADGHVRARGGPPACGAAGVQRASASQRVPFLGGVSSSPLQVDAPAGGRLQRRVTPNSGTCCLATSRR